MTDFEFSVENLSASAGDKSILKNVAFNHDYNSLAALMGPMGGGKSTFLKVLAGNAGKEGIATQFDRASYRGKPLGPSHFPLYIRQKIREKCDFLAEIPTSGPELSLNVSVATGICLYEAHKQRVSRG